MDSWPGWEAWQSLIEGERAKNYAKTLVLVPDSRLGDFNRALFSAFAFAWAHKRALKVVRQKTFACSFNGVDNPFLHTEEAVFAEEPGSYREIWTHLGDMRHPKNRSAPQQKPVVVGNVSLSSGWSTHHAFPRTRAMVIVGAHWRAEKEMRQLEVHLGKMGIRIPALPLYGSFDGEDVRFGYREARSRVLKTFYTFDRGFLDRVEAVARPNLPCTAIHIRSLRFLRESGSAGMLKANIAAAQEAGKLPRQMKGLVHDDAIFIKNLTLFTPESLRLFCTYAQAADLLERKHRLTQNNRVVFSDSVPVAKYVSEHCGGPGSKKGTFFTKEPIHVLRPHDYKLEQRFDSGAPPPMCDYSFELIQWYYMTRCDVAVISPSGFSSSASLRARYPIAEVGSKDIRRAHHRDLRTGHAGHQSRLTVAAGKEVAK